MIIDLYNELYTELSDMGLNVLTSFPDSKLDETPEFPCVVFKEMYNHSDTDNTRDSDGEKYNIIYFELQIFTQGTNKRSSAATIRGTIDGMFSDKYGMYRNYADEVPNYIDREIYRYALRYECKVDTNKIIYRR